MFDIFGAKDPKKALQKAHEYIREGKVPSAIRVLEDNLTESEESFDLFLELSRLYSETDQRSRALDLIRRVQTIAPSRVDELIALLSELFYQHTSIDIGDLLIQLYASQQQYEEVGKVLRAFTDREIRLLLTRYEKLKHFTVDKKVLTKKDLDNILILSSINIFLQNSKEAFQAVEPIIGLENFRPQIIAWAKTVAREYFNDPHTALILLKAQLGYAEFDSAITQAQRIFEKFPDLIDPLIEVIKEAHPPKGLESNFSQLLTDLYVKKGDLEGSIKMFEELLKRDASKVDDVIKGLRELERISPKNLKVLYGLSDTYLNAGRLALAINEFEKILELDPAQYSEILARYKKAFEREPTNPLVIQGLVNLELKENNLLGALEILETAYNLDPGLYDEYILNLNSILEKDINNHQALFLLGLCYAHKGEKDNALLIFEKLVENRSHELVNKALDVILKLKPDDLAYLNLKAKNLVMLGKVEEALAILKPFLNQKIEEAQLLLPALDLIINKRPDFSSDIIRFYDWHKEENPEIFELALARFHAFCADYDKAVQDFERCLSNPGQKDIAKRALIEVIKERPNAVPLLLAAARIFLKEGAVEIATEFFKTAQAVDPQAFFEIVDEFYDTLKTFPKDREVRRLLIDTFFNRRLWDRVIEECRIGIEVFGQEAQYFKLKLGQALLASGSLTEAVRPLMLALEGEDDYSLEVITSLNKILEIDKSNVPAHFALGRALAKARQIDEAVEEYLLTARIVPARVGYVLEELRAISSRAIAHPKVLFAMGNIEISLKKYDEGSKHLLQSCELDATLINRVLPIFENLCSVAPSPVLEFSLARLYQLANLRSSAVKFYISAQSHDKKLREQVITELKRICAAAPADIESRKGLAQVYLDYNDLEDALSLAQEIYELDLSENSWVKSFVQQILEKNPRHLPSYYLLSLIFLQEAKYANAIEVFKKLIEISPAEITRVIDNLLNYQEKSPAVLFYLGVLYKKIGQIQNAIQSFEKLTTRESSYDELIIAQTEEILLKESNLGEAYFLASKIWAAKKEYEKAIESLKRAEGLLPEKREEIILKEGQLYFEIGDANKTIEIYNRLLKETKDRKGIYRIIKKTRNDYLKERIDAIKGASDEDRLARAKFYLLMDKISEAEEELKFIPQNNEAAKQQAILRAQACLEKNRLIDAFEIMKNWAADAETGPTYVEIYAALGAYEAAAAVLRQLGIEDFEERLKIYEKRAQERRLAKTGYFIEGRF